MSRGIKDLVSTLEVGGLRDRTQSLSNVDILISPCDSSTSSTLPAAGLKEADFDKSSQKSRLEAVSSFPLEKGKVSQLFSSPTLDSKMSISTVVCSPIQQEGLDSLTGPQAMKEKDGGEKEGSKLPGQELKGETAAGDQDEEEEELLVVKDRMYPTLRSKSLNTNPRKTRTKKQEEEEMPCSSGSVKDLVSVFRGGQEALNQNQNQNQRL
ncbi:uncharacterized protein V3H82_022641 [Fundulus diaphanus]